MRAGVKRTSDVSPKRLAELAEYFDGTDAGDLDWQTETGDVIERPELEQISLRLPKQDLALLKKRAADLGVGYTTLIRMILRRYVHNPLMR